jgi:hypothetical protein
VTLIMSPERLVICEKNQDCCGESLKSENPDGAAGMLSADDVPGMSRNDPEAIRR